MKWMPADQELVARACDALCRPLWLGTLWQDGRPTERAADLRAARRLGKRERILVHVAWSLWNGSGDIHLSELDDLEPADVRAFAGLLLALLEGQLATEIWIEGQVQRARRDLERARAKGAS
jgi:hypothetical protein